MFSGLLAGFSWALDTLILSVVLSLFQMQDLLFMVPIISTFLHDMFSFFWIFFYLLLKKKLNNIIQLLNNKGIIFIILSSLLGSLLGMGGYVLSLKSIGATYTTMISCCYPALGALFSFFFFKKRLSFLQLFGIVLCIFSVVLLSYSPTLASFSFDFIFGLLCCIGWSLEAIVLEYSFHHHHLSYPYVLLIRQGVSMISFGLILLCIQPVYIIPVYSYFIIIISALCGTLSYLFYYYAIDRIGSTKAMFLNMTYCAFSLIIVSIITFKIPDFKSIVCCLLIIVGAILVSKK